MNSTPALRATRATGRAAPRPSRRPGLSRLELFVAFVVGGLLLVVTHRALLHSRETARRQTCADHLRQLHLGLASYHDGFSVLPPAAVWGGPQSSDGQVWPRADDIAAATHQNWVQLLLPYAGEGELADAADPASPIGSPANADVRRAALAWMRCPSDEFHRQDNRYLLRRGAAGEIEFARGNYAINGGTQRMALAPGTSADPAPGGIHAEVDASSGTSAYWGNGVAGFNKSFGLNEIANGLSTTVAVDEIRAGIDPRDSRGVWALGQIGGSVTWAHGMNGDAGGPNATWKRADDVAGCPELHQAYGEERLVKLGMPCCSYCAINEQATARSRHPGGVHVLMLDGSVHFVSDDVAPGVWHVMHSRETPADVLRGAFDDGPPRPVGFEATAAATAEPPPVRGAATGLLTNSIGMELVRLPAGRFLMGQPDEEINAVFEIEGTAPAHWVELSRPTWMSAHEVTRFEYAAVTGRDPDGSLGADGEPFGRDDDSGLLPISSVTWHDADEFCQRLSESPTEVSAGRRYRLPTEAEWEYACRAGASDPHIYIPKRQPGDQTGENAMKDPPLPIAEVGRYPPNAFGLYDMRGNVWEWCGDWSHPEYYASTPSRDPQGPATGYLKVVRGADWLYVGQRCMLGFRATEPWLRSPFIGFRVVCETSGPP